jgi:hypothetical protein
MKDTAESATLRTMLQKVNREYSATLRGREVEEREAKLEGLRRQRLALMLSIAELRGLQGAKAIPAYAPISETFANEPLRPVSWIAIRQRGDMGA